ncbi:MAG: alpha-N-acetylgalactosaminidase [Saprospiraceae bacterium]|nr:MAG: alpha-N-acetylgalactosaminidase [Saprospiraceae bacterium]
MDKKLDRRTFLQNSVLASAGLAIPGTTTPQQQAVFNKTTNKSKIRIGVIGVGMRGQSHVDLALNRDDCEVTAICDIDPEMIARTKELFTKKGKPQPKVFQNGERGYLEMLAVEDIDAVLIATPWRWHTEMAVASMQAGKYTGTEVCGAFSLDECWQLVNTHESTGTHLFFLENVCYRRDVMAVLNMVRQGLFGEMMHLEGGYQHDLRGVKFNDGKTPYNSGVEFGEKGFSEAKWRTGHSVYRNGDLYPTHGVGPVAQYIDINRGNRFMYLTSMASKARGLHNYIVEHEKGGPNHPNAQVEFKLGDKVTTMIKTAKEETIVLHHDTNLPRPYSLGFRVQGTKGLWMVVNKSIHLEGTSPGHSWEDAQPYLDKYDHPLWKRHEQRAVGAGHGGMDFFLLHAFVESAKLNIAPPFDVYDAASWLAITPLSEQSIAAGGAPIAFPDFTRGRWMNRTNEFARGDEF